MLWCSSASRSSLFVIRCVRGIFLHTHAITGVEFVENLSSSSRAERTFVTVLYKRRSVSDEWFVTNYLTHESKDMELMMIESLESNQMTKNYFCAVGSSSVVANKKWPAVWCALSISHITSRKVHAINIVAGRSSQHTSSLTSHFPITYPRWVYFEPKIWWSNLSSPAQVQPIAYWQGDKA